MTVQYQGVWSLQSAAQLQSTQRWVTDPFYKNTTLLLQADDAANGSQNNTFLDSSSNSFAITRNGNTTQGSFTPFSSQPGAWSAYLTGVYGSSTFTSRTLFNGNSTIEGWVYPNALSGQQTIIVGGGINFGTNNAKLRIDDGVNAGSIFESTGTIAANTWNHVAVVRTSNTFAFYINGNLDSSNASISSFYTSNATSLNVGAFNNVGTNAFTGYLSNIRVSNVARTISVPSIPYSSDADTVWLIFQSNRFVDNSSNAYALTFAGTPSVQAFSPFAPQFQWTPSVIGGSGYFDGTGDYLSAAANTALTFGTGDFTVEGWFYANALGGQPALLNNGSDAGGLVITTLSSKIYAYFVGAGNVFGSGGATLATNTWYHFAWVRSGSTHTFYLNGAVYGATYSSAGNHASTGGVGIGYSVAGTAFAAWNGYIADVRMVKGTAVYTTAFTPPTAPLTAITNTSLLANFTNAGIYDGTMKNNLETVGNAQVSTAVVKYGSGSMAFDGSGDSLDINNTQLGIFSSGDFTIECWIYLNALPGSGSNYQIIDFRGFGVGTNVAPCLSLYNASGTYNIRFESGSSVIADRSVSVSTRIWYHLAAVRSNGNVSIYWNGTISGTAFSVTTNYSTGYPVRIGAYTSSVSVLNGYIDDLRVTRGIARYTQNFIPPSVALPRQ